MTVRRLISHVLGIGVIIGSLTVVSSANAQGLGIPGQPDQRQGPAAPRGGGAVAPTLQPPGQMLPLMGRQTSGFGSVAAPSSRGGTISSRQFTSERF
jgi:hypothetical protein